MIFRELSNAAFRFSLRRPGAEIMGGGAFKRLPPPPQQAVENPEAQQGGGLNSEPCKSFLNHMHDFSRKMATQISEGLQKVVLSEGTGQRPNRGDTITVQCTGMLHGNPPKKFWR